jgi:multiple sugar transport system permease protein
VRYGAAAAYAVILFLYVFAVAFAFVGLLGANAFDDENESPRPSLLERLRRLDRSRKSVRP